MMEKDIVRELVENCRGSDYPFFSSNIVCNSLNFPGVVSVAVSVCEKGNHSPIEEALNENELMYFNSWISQEVLVTYICSLYLC